MHISGGGGAGHARRRLSRRWRRLPRPRISARRVLWYEGCESLAGQNQDLGIRINGATLVDGKIGKALLLERRDANRLANPDFDGLGDWIAVGRPTPASAGGRFSPGCVQITENDYVRQVVTELRSGDETWYCLRRHTRSPTLPGRGSSWASTGSFAGQFLFDRPIHAVGAAVSGRA